MTPAQVAALTVGASVNDGTNSLATVAYTRMIDNRFPADPDGIIELAWLSKPTNSVFSYNDPCFRRFT